jgi:hypothetical protein
MIEISEAQAIVNNIQAQMNVLLARSRLPPTAAHLAAVTAELEAAQAQLELAKTRKAEREIAIEKLKEPQPFTPAETLEQRAAHQARIDAAHDKAAQPYSHLSTTRSYPPTVEQRKAAMQREAFVEQLRKA